MFTEHDGVGDDNLSYAIDGFRVSKWNGSQVKFGKHWEVGKELIKLIIISLINYYLLLY